MLQDVITTCDTSERDGTQRAGQRLGSRPGCKRAQCSAYHANRAARELPPVM